LSTHPILYPALGFWSKTAIFLENSIYLIINNLCTDSEKLSVNTVQIVARIVKIECPRQLTKCQIQSPEMHVWKIIFSSTSHFLQLSMSGLIQYVMRMFLGKCVAGAKR
ncbi:MAG: hypothetical protein NC206_07480, partial [Bacteroides sp.]|nr:hypothetical protein [Bacteroides sp.]